MTDTRERERFFFVTSLDEIKAEDRPTIYWKEELIKQQAALDSVTEQLKLEYTDETSRRSRIGFKHRVSLSVNLISLYLSEVGVEDKYNKWVDDYVSGLTPSLITTPSDVKGTVRKALESAAKVAIR